jgi:allantoinase
MGKRTIVWGGSLGTETGTIRADLVIEDEQIAAVMADASELGADERIDATGLLVMPGGIDAHTHFKEPNTAPLEGFYTGSLGAIAGGVTTVIEMPQAVPVSTDGALVAEKRRVGETQSIVDFALWGAAVNQDLAKLDEMIDEGIVAMKSFMSTSSPTFPRATDDTLVSVFRHLAESGMPYGLHPENEELLQAGTARLRAEGRTDVMAHAESRPPIVEIEAINRALLFAEATGGYAYICHCSSVGGLELVRRAKDRGVRVSAETCPQYLALDEEDLRRLGPFGRCAPAIRAREEVEGIWSFIADGTIDVISSDHCGFSIESKLAGSKNIWDAPLGLSGIQTMFPMVLDEMVNKRNLDIATFVRLSSANPARIFGLHPRKGSLQVGSDADLALYDPNKIWVVRGADMLHRHKWTPFDGREVRGSVVRTIIRGQTVFRREGQNMITAAAGSGRFLRRGYGQTIGI